MADKLLPCPFCNKSPKHHSDYDGMNKWWEISCDTCCLTMKEYVIEPNKKDFVDFLLQAVSISDAKKTCIETWNNRYKNE